MLTRNGRNAFAAPGPLTGGSQAQQFGNVVKGGFRNRFVGGLDPIFGGYANGHLAPSSFVLPTEAGSISSYTESEGEISGIGTLTPGRPLTASALLQILGTGTLDVIFLEFLTATGTMTMSQGTVTLGQILQLLANGSMVISVDQALLSTAVSLNAAGTLQIVGTGTLGGIFGISASGSMVLTPNVISSALANMIAIAGGPDPLSPQGLANAVWERQVDGSVTSEEILRVLAAVAAGKTTIDDLGGGAATVVFRNLTDALDRVTADMQDSERIDVTLELD
jgi:hypothetical protein